MLFVTFFAPHLLAMLVAAPLLPASFAAPVKVATPWLTAAEKPWVFRLGEVANLSLMHFSIVPSSTSAMVILLVTLLAPQPLARLVAAPLLPAFLTFPVKVAVPLLTVALIPCVLRLADAASLSLMHF